MRTAVLAVAVVLALAGTAATAATPATQRSVYTPFAADGSLRAGLRAVDRDGECFTSSLLVGRAGALRCITGNRLRDPCFREPDPSSPVVVICAEDPWRQTVVRIRLAAQAPADGPAGHRSPWALELAGGARCVLVGGATNIVRGYRLNYICAANRFLWGSPRTSSPTWRIRQSRSADGRRMQLVAIRRAWR
jgi:hypothetical protein